MRLPDKIDIAIMSGLLGLASLAVFLVIANVELPEREVDVVVYQNGAIIHQSKTDNLDLTNPVKLDPLVFGEHANSPIVILVTQGHE